MSFDGIIGSDGANRVRSAQSAAAAGGVLAAIPIRQRSEPLDSSQVSRRPAPSQRDRFQVAPKADDTSPNRSRATRDDAPAERGTDGPVSAFLAQSLAQDGNGAESPAVAADIRIGIDAYRRAAGPETGETDPQVDILPPPGGALASGHRLDLAI
ncbi:hypothetical protein A6A04_05595 [Paramagnetospirillum marisnigri]|uniref:Uncharacterized protein n=1 Tax=Paramagnetospirillum marisnigri TaxID=1285242 RepID=A0A178MEV2_9PROT|nr:hypothetical protein [Paramagnetospirillum marisnigri]OAN46588.1 hypothetical protein A6A04_05595 [Paramagnetospirillum marisnigri]